MLMWKKLIWLQNSIAILKCDHEVCHTYYTSTFWFNWLFLGHSYLASFQGARKVGRSTWYTLFAHVRLPTFFSGKLRNFRKINSVTLTLACQSISPVWKMPAIDHALSKRWWGSDENTQLFTCKNYSPVCPFQVNTVASEWCNLSLWSSLIALNEMIQAIAVKVITFLTLNLPPNVSHREHNSAVWLISR